MTVVALPLTQPRPAPFIVGVVAWALAMVLLPAPLAARILLLAPLAIVPGIIDRLPPRRWFVRVSGWIPLVAALSLLVAFSVPAGPLGVGLALPWLGLALVGAAAAVDHGIRNLASFLRLRAAPSLGFDAALGFWAVGAAFIVADRSGVEMGFSPPIVLLTAVHFHFAGVGLLALASLLAARRPRLQVPVLGLIVGIPLTALGFVVASDQVNALGAVIVGSSGIGVAIGLLTTGRAGWRGWMSRAAALALFVGMPMGIAWSLAILLGGSFLDLETMIRTHGVLNSAAVLLGVAALVRDEG